MRRPVLAVWSLVLVSLSGCGGGGGGGGQGIDLRALFWGVPFVPSGSGRTMFVGLRNLETDATTVTLQGYMPDGTSYTGPVTVDLDGNDELHLSANAALGGDTPAGGWILVNTPSERVEVFFDVRQPSTLEGEAARAVRLGDLAGAPAATSAGLTTTFETRLIQISNATGAAKTVRVTPFEEPLGDPSDSPIEHPSVDLAFAPFETKTFDPDGLSGITDFFGSFFFSSTDPFFVAAEEDLSFDAQVALETRFVSVSDNFLADVGVQFGREVTPFGDNVFDFALLARNDSDEPQSFTVQSIHDAGGFPILTTPRVVTLDAHESRVESTTGELFGDLFGDPFLFGGVQLAHILLNIPVEVDVSFRQFDPISLIYKATFRPIPIGHVFEASDVRPDVPGRFEWMVVMNPTSNEVEAEVSVLIPEPEGFEASAIPLMTVLLPPNGAQKILLQDLDLVNRDGDPVTFTGVRLSSLAALGVFFFEEQRTGTDLVVLMTPRVTANLEDAR
jgi:hypothetical protein